MQNPAAAACPCISSLVLTLDEAPALRAQSLLELRALSGVEISDQGGPWVAAVIDSAEPEELIERISAVPGVRYVEVIFVEVAETAPSSPSLSNT